MLDIIQTKVLPSDLNRFLAIDGWFFQFFLFSKDQEIGVVAIDPECFFDASVWSSFLRSSSEIAAICARVFWVVSCF